jgi:hypothetical protein
MGAWNPSTAREVTQIRFRGMVLSTSRQARSVNDDPLARFSNLGEELEIADDRTARARHDAHVGERRRRGNDGQDDSEDESPHGDLRSPPLAPLVTGKPAKMQHAHPGFNERHWYDRETADVSK